VRIATGIRVKLMMIDEGHVAGTTTDAMRLAIALSIERRWIVSGSKLSLSKGV
jgi:hypothetical protein